MPILRKLFGRADKRPTKGAETRLLNWEALDPAPMPRYVAAQAGVGDKWFCIAGYVTLDEVRSAVDVFDLKVGRWREPFPTPPEMGHNHLGCISDGERYVYIVSGQRGPHCSPAVASVFALDVANRTWSALPPLPEARYAPVTQLWNGRLHVLGGSKPDRFTVACEHWSLGVESGRATEHQWRVEPPAPRGGPHGASAVVGGQLYLLGGQEGDWMPAPGCPQCTCVPVDECPYPDCWRMEPGATQWTRLPDMPVVCSHAEGATIVDGDRVLLLGGQIASLRLTDVVQAFDTREERWQIVGRLPYRLKTAVATLYEGFVYVSCGQRDAGPKDSRPGAIMAATWRAPLDF